VGAICRVVGWGLGRPQGAPALCQVVASQGDELMLLVETSLFVSHGRAVSAGLAPALVVAHLAPPLTWQGVTRGYKEALGP